MSDLNPKTEEDPEVEIAKMPVWLLGIGFAATIGTTILAGRLVWEQTVWTWESGEQMVGFSLMHGSAATLVLSPIVLIAWLIAAIAFMMWSAVKKRRLTRTSWAVVGAALALLGVLMLPYSFWQRLFVGRLAKGPHAADFAISAAAQGDLRTLEKFLSHGVPVGARNRAGQTPLHAAAVGGQLQVVEYLVARGADVNAIDRYGDSPLEVAASEKHDSVAKFLAARGGRRIHGDSVTRKKATEDIVDEDIARVGGPQWKRGQDSARPSHVPPTPPR